VASVGRPFQKWYAVEVAPAPDLVQGQLFYRLRSRRLDVRRRVVRTIAVFIQQRGHTPANRDVDAQVLRSRNFPSRKRDADQIQGQVGVV